MGERLTRTRAPIRCQTALLCALQPLHQLTPTPNVNGLPLQVNLHGIKRCAPSTLANADILHTIPGGCGESSRIDACNKETRVKCDHFCELLFCFGSVVFTAAPQAPTRPTFERNFRTTLQFTLLQ